MTLIVGSNARSINAILILKKISYYLSTLLRQIVIDGYITSTLISITRYTYLCCWILLQVISNFFYFIVILGTNDLSCTNSKENITAEFRNLLNDGSDCSGSTLDNALLQINGVNSVGSDRHFTGRVSLADIELGTKQSVEIPVSITSTLTVIAVAEGVAVNFNTYTDSIRDTEVSTRTELSNETALRTFPKIIQILCTHIARSCTDSITQQVISCGVSLCSLIIVPSDVGTNTSKGSQIEQAVSFITTEEVREVDGSIYRGSNIIILPFQLSDLIVVRFPTATALPSIHSKAKTKYRIKFVASSYLYVVGQQILKSDLTKGILCTNGLNLYIEVRYKDIFCQGFGFLCGSAQTAHDHQTGQ